MPGGCVCLNTKQKVSFYQVSVCQVAWVLLEYTRTAMFHWMFLEVCHDDDDDCDGDGDGDGDDESMMMVITIVGTFRNVTCCSAVAPLLGPIMVTTLNSINVNYNAPFDLR